MPISENKSAVFTLNTSQGCQISMISKDLEENEQKSKPLLSNKNQIDLGLKKRLSPIKSIKEEEVMPDFSFLKGQMQKTESMEAFEQKLKEDKFEKKIDLEGIYELSGESKYPINFQNCKTLFSEMIPKICL